MDFQESPELAAFRAEARAFLGHRTRRILAQVACGYWGLALLCSRGRVLEALRPRLTLNPLHR